LKICFQRAFSDITHLNAYGTNKLVLEGTKKEGRYSQSCNMVYKLNFCNAIKSRNAETAVRMNS
jgi:hypothetical protein